MLDRPPLEAWIILDRLSAGRESIIHDENLEEQHAARSIIRSPTTILTLLPLSSFFHSEIVDKSTMSQEENGLLPVPM
jgi:hypothetical protein